MTRKILTLKANPKGMKYRIYCTLCILVITFAAIIFHSLNVAASEKKLYREADGKIVVIFNEKADSNTLNSITKTLGTPVEVLKHMDDYALLSVKDELSFKDVINSLSQNPLVKTVPAICVP